jgi:hypothetical protein
MADNAEFQNELSVWKIAHPEEKSHEERVAEFKEKSSQWNQMENPSPFVCDEVYKYAKYRDFGEGVVNMLLAESLSVSDTVNVSSGDRSILEVMKKDFEKFSQMMRLLVVALREYSQVSTICDCGLTLAIIMKECKPEQLGRVLFADLSKFIALVASKSLYSVSAMLRTQSKEISDVYSSAVNAWGATCGVPDQKKKASLMADWRELFLSPNRPDWAAKSTFQPVLVMVREGSAPYLKEVEVDKEVSVAAVAVDVEKSWSKLHEEEPKIFQ